MSHPPSLKITVAAGTYDGVLAGWELSTRTRKLKLQFASPVHGGSVRALALAGHTTTRNNNHNHTNNNTPHSILVSCGYDESLQTHDFTKGLLQAGQLRTPADFGTPTCLQFAPPCQGSTHLLVGFADSSGKLVLYKKKDWSICHVLSGHAGGVASCAVHPSGKLALTGGRTDGKVNVWDLMTGRLAYCHKITTMKLTKQAIETIVWTRDGTAYGLCHGVHVTVRDVESNKELLDVELPSRVNQICFMYGNQGLFVVAACNDGSLPVLKVGSVSDTELERRAIMAIEPVDSAVAGEERFKCIQSVTGYIVATANSAGVVSVMNLQGAVSMICEQGDDSDNEVAEESPVHPESDNDDDDDDDESVELAVDLFDSIQLGTGARITCLAAWCEEMDEEDQTTPDEMTATKEDIKEEKKEQDGPKRKREPSNSKNTSNEVVLANDALEKARHLVADAKKIQKRNEKKRHKKRHGPK